jgi:dolichol-phosphate mannosyltransferase
MRMENDLIIHFFSALPEPLRKLFPYREKWFGELCLFTLVGLSSASIMLILLYVLTEFFGIFYLFSAAIALLISAINGYLWNHRWTFKTEEERNHHIAFSKYLALNIVTYLLNLSILVALVEMFGIWYIFAEVFAMFIAFLGNFVGSKFWVFRQ